MIAAAGFLTEYFWPVGDPRWAYILVSGAIVIPLLYSPEIITWLRKITSPRNWLWRRKDHKVSASPVRFHFSVPEASGTLRRAPWCKRVWRRMLNEIKAWGEG